MPASATVPMGVLLGGLPEPWPEDLRPRICSAVRASGRKLVVLDDDPTGTQTVHGLPVLTHWSESALRRELENEISAFFILTNSRSLPPERARQISFEIGLRLQRASQAAGRPFAVVSRSDSTLRGHFPGEMTALSDSLGAAVDGWILCPFFEEGGRYTAGDVHYVREGEVLVPAGGTDFARDAAFGFRASNLRRWVAEKSKGRLAAEDTLSVSIEDLRCGGPGRVEKILSSVGGEAVCVVNAVSYRDLEVFVLGLLAAEKRGKVFLYRTAASFVQVRAGLRPRPLLSAAEWTLPDAGGLLVIVGSHVAKTTRQLERLLAARPDMTALKVDVGVLLDESRRAAAVEAAALRADAALQKGRGVVLYTSRRFRGSDSPEAGLAAGRRISEGLVSILDRVRSRPRAILAKGGITASDVAAKGLGIRRAMVHGQILPGVPVWVPGPESRFPGCPYIVFPGNVGDDGALLSVVSGFDP